MHTQVKVEKPKDIQPLTADELAQSRLSVITSRGSIRVGYFAASLPYVFRNGDNQLVGFDMELIHELARELKLSVDLVYIKKPKDQEALLANGSIDIAVGGQIITPLRALKTAFSTTYTHHTLGVIVPDSNRDSFGSVGSMNEAPKLTLGIPNSAYYHDLIVMSFPNAEFKVIADVRSFLKGKHPEVDALVYSAEAASAWSMLYPEYSAVIPKGLMIEAPIAFTLPKGDFEYSQFINSWLELKRENNFIEQVYSYWILGKNPEAKKPRWSVLKNVIGADAEND